MDNTNNQAFVVSSNSIAKKAKLTKATQQIFMMD